jgi:hypothetical protein
VETQYQNPATCKHPEGHRSSLHGFGQRSGDVRTFFCRMCQTHVDLDELAAALVRARLTGGADAVPGSR